MRKACAQRSRNYRHVFDNERRLHAPARQPAASWLEIRSTRAAIGHSNRWRDFTESNAWQATFLNQHDLYAYMQLFGGEAGVREASSTACSAHRRACPATHRRISPAWSASTRTATSPAITSPYLYAYTGAHHKTQARVRMLLDTMYRAEPDGLAGNEDCGQMSAWYVMGALGLYAVDPVSTNYVFGSPLLDRAEIAIGERPHAGGGDQRQRPATRPTSSR